MKRIEKPIMCIGDLGVDIFLDSQKRLSVEESTKVILKGEQVKLTDGTYTTLLFGGTVGNTSIVLSRLGTPTAFLGKIGDDVFGKFLLNKLKSEGVDTQWVLKDKDRFTFIVIVHIDGDGNKDFFLYPQTGSAYASLESVDISADIFSKSGLVFTTGINLVEEPISTTIIDLVKKCKTKNIPVAFDLNLRTNIYGWDQNIREIFQEVIHNCNIIFGSGKDELAVITGEHDEFKAAQKLITDNRIVICKMGEDGAVYFSKKEAYKIPAFPVDVESTLGAGDTFNGGFLSAYAQGKSIPECLLYGSAAAAYTIRFTDRSNCPNENQLSGFIKENEMIFERIEKIW